MNLGFRKGQRISWAAQRLAAAEQELSHVINYLISWTFG
jgi:hypothetical protein